MGTITYALIWVCTFICIYIAYRSYANAKKGYMDNGSQYATTFGVLFTFLGVAIALWNFDANGSVETIKEGIMLLVDGMRMAFITSIIGMMTGIIIRWLIQGKIERDSEEESSSDIRTIARNSERLNVLKELVKDIFVRVEENKKRTAERWEQFLRMEQDSKSSAEEQEKSASERWDQLIRMEQEFHSSMKSSFEQLIQIERDSTFSRYISELMALHKAYIKLAEENNAHLNTLAKDSDIYERLLSTMQSLQESIDHSGFGPMKELDQQLIQHFGGNLSDLNNSMVALHAWQEGYKENILDTIGELHFINNVFAQFSTDIMPAITESSAKLRENLQMFADASEKNVGIQAQLLNTATQLEKAVEDMRESCSTFEACNRKLLTSIHENMDKHEKSRPAAMHRPSEQRRPNDAAKRPFKKRRN